ncbi:hypothetical protein [Cryobacterium sp. TMS1-20-1]|nr:hypothetical protein [Cryobacterium sp. TMS1-20-1]
MAARASGAGEAAECRDDRSRADQRHEKTRAAASADMMVESQLA